MIVTPEYLTKLEASLDRLGIGLWERYNLPSGTLARWVLASLTDRGYDGRPTHGLGAAVWAEPLRIPRGNAPPTSLYGRAIPYHGDPNPSFDGVRVRERQWIYSIALRLLDVRIDWTTLKPVITARDLGKHLHKTPSATTLTTDGLRQALDAERSANYPCTWYVAGAEVAATILDLLTPRTEND